MIFTIVLLALLCITSHPIQAEAADETNLTFELVNGNQEYFVTGCDLSATGELLIPSTYNGLPITGIGENAFSHCTGLTKVVIPKSNLMHSTFVIL